MSELTPRPVRDSLVIFTRPMTFHDANGLGNVHGGVIMHEVDTAAGAASARHVGGPCVTAAIDELSFTEPVHVGDLLVVTASVNAAGRRSLEVGVKVEAEPWLGGPRRHTTSAYLVMVAIDAEGRPREVPPLVAETEDERRREAQAAIRRQIRQERRSRIGAWRPDVV
ncbi:acyl-CoA thioesterase [Nitriliruptor alkaliphilus]|uniref:acyl-CoA thioesterase n=1 Tax=Nitriliruptor alkaliphilus TaxID=427918 RepID=UPI000697114C|nr:acyl-CoA thioesterase [Nitriliruptor alkaliphilus]